MKVVDLDLELTQAESDLMAALCMVATDADLSPRQKGSKVEAMTRDVPGPTMHRIAGLLLEVADDPEAFGIELDGYAPTIKAHMRALAEGLLAVWGASSN